MRKDLWFSEASAKAVLVVVVLVVVVSCFPSTSLGDGILLEESSASMPLISEAQDFNATASAAKLFATNRRGNPQGEYTMCQQHPWVLALRKFIEEKPGEVPEMKELARSPWIPFAPHAELTGWRFLPTETTTQRDVLKPYHLNHLGMENGAMKIVWMENPGDGPNDMLGVILCGEEESPNGIPAVAWINRARMEPSIGLDRANLEWWAFGLLVWAYDRTGELPERVEDWDLITFTQPTEETAAWTQAARARLQEVLDVAREASGG